MHFTRRQALLTASAAALAGCASASNGAGADQGAALNAFFEDAFEQAIVSSPQLATSLGDRRGYGQWDDPSDAAARAQLDARIASRNEMRRRFNPETLSPGDRLSYRLYDHGVTRSEEGWRWRNHGYIFNHMGGAQSGVPSFLGGWSEEVGVYAFWDARRHTRFSQKSPSLQVHLNTLETAGSVGLATQLRPTAEGEEVVVSVSTGSLLWYLENGVQLHNSQSDATAVADLVDATPEDERAFLDSSKSESQTARRYDLVETMRAFRDAQFRPAVLHAYGYRCAVCNCDLKLVDAAHIVPVSHPSSIDDVTNGIALCRLHHGAFDNALLGFQSSFRIVVNPQTVRRLQEIGLATGIDQFRNQLPELIRVPASIEARPSPQLLRLGLQLRGFPSDLIC